MVKRKDSSISSVEKLKGEGLVLGQEERFYWRLEGRALPTLDQRKSFFFFF